MIKKAILLSFLLAFGVFKTGVINAAESESYDVDQVQEEINQLAETELSVSIQHISIIETEVSYD